MNLNKKREKRRLLGIAMGTELPPDRRIIGAVQRNITEDSKLNEDKTHMTQVVSDYKIKQYYKPIDNEENMEVPAGNSTIKFLLDNYNVSLMENGMMTQDQILEKRKQDAKNAILTLYKRQKEESLILEDMSKKEISDTQLKDLNERLKLVINGKDIAKNRIEWLLRGTNITFEMLQQEIAQDKQDKSGKEHNLSSI